MPLLDILAMGIDSSHEPEFVIDRPAGLGCFLLMCFSTPFLCATIHGIQEGRAGDCVLHDPTFAQWHGPDPKTRQGFCNDWIHFTGRGVRALAAKYGLPFNQILPTGTQHLLADKLKAIEIELFHRHPLWKESAGLELEGALIRISRLVQFAKYDSTLGVRERDHLQRFREIRSILYQRSSEHWTAASLAEMAGLGVNRFTVLYKKFFHISPIDDLISIRLEKSKRMLLRGGWSVGEVAERCGFSSMYYFSRIFKSKVGCSPRVFLRQAVSPGG